MLITLCGFSTSLLPIQIHGTRSAQVSADAEPATIKAKHVIIVRI